MERNIGVRLVEFTEEGDIVFNWHQLPEPLCLNFELRDKIFKELQDAFGKRYVDSGVLYEINTYVINRIKNALHDKAGSKNT